MIRPIHSARPRSGDHCFGAGQTLMPRVTIHLGGPGAAPHAGMHRQPMATEFHKTRRPWFN